MIRCNANDNNPCNSPTNIPCLCVCGLNGCSCLNNIMSVNCIQHIHMQITHLMHDGWIVGCHPEILFFQSESEISRFPRNYYKSQEFSKNTSKSRDL